MITNNYADRTRGGVEMHVHNLSHALVVAGHEVTVARTSQGPSIHELDLQVPVVPVLGDSSAKDQRMSNKLSSIPLVRFASNFLGRITTAIKAGRRLREDPEFLAAFDIVHHHDFITSAIVARMLRGFAIKQIWTNHLGEFLILRRLPVVGPILTRYLTRTFDAGIGPSGELSDPTTVSCSIEYIPNGVNIDAFAPLSSTDRNLLRAKRGLGQNDLIAIVPRRWAPTKGVLFAAEAMSSEHWPSNCSVIFAGAGETEFPEYSSEIREALTAAVASFEIIDTLSMGEMAEALQGADICIIPSLMEATSLSALEAMAVCLPIVSTDVGGLPEIVHEGVNGHLVPSADAKAIARAVANICRLTADERQKMGSVSRTQVVSTYSWDEIGARTLRVYREVSV